jgi:tRNA (adenine22-N1)-methyltransferase
MLSLRLKTLINFYKNQPIAYDLACDHGLLGIKLAENDHVLKVFLIDQSLAVYNNLVSKLKIQPLIIQNKCHALHDKAQNIHFMDGSIIYLAGVGGNLIYEVLSIIEKQKLLDVDIVICPHQDVFALREKLSKSAWKASHDILLEEDGQFYHILKLSLSYGSTVSRFGDFWNEPSSRRYEAHIRQHFKSHRDPVSQDLIAYLNTL